MNLKKKVECSRSGIPDDDAVLAKLTSSLSLGGGVYFKGYDELEVKSE